MDDQLGPCLGLLLGKGLWLLGGGAGHACEDGQLGQLLLGAEPGVFEDQVVGLMEQFAPSRPLGVRHHADDLFQIPVQDRDLGDIAASI